MGNNRKTGNTNGVGAFFLIMSFLAFIVSFFLHNQAELNKGTSVTFIAGKTSLGGGQALYNPEKVQFFTIAFWICIILGVLFLIMSIAMFVSNGTYSKEYEDNFSGIVCTKCGKINTLSKSKCVYCGNQLVMRETSNNTWICPKCGKENMNYTGTCGCGTMKPHS